MKIRLNVILTIVGIITVLVSCQSKLKRPANLSPNAHMVIAKEVLQTNSYTYVRVQSEEDQEYWLAINSAEIKVGDTYFWSRGMPMNNFTSRELKRTFPTIFFVENFTDKPITVDDSLGVKKIDLSMASRAGKQQAAEQENIIVEKAKDGITIAELFSQKESYSGKKVKIAGQVVRFSKDIMKKNWVHIQDGTKAGKYYDLTITTTDTVKFGDVVTFQGVISLNKDFGYGYFYDLVMEDGTLVTK